MNVTLRTPLMTREQFLDWVERQEEPYEFDGYEPVPMTGGTLRHALLCSNILFALRKRVEGLGFDVLHEAGVATVGNALRYPDVMIIPSGGPLQDRIMPDPLVVFEIVSPSSGRTDRHVKLREYRAAQTIRRYIIVDGDDLTVYFRSEAGQDWVADALSRDDVISLPEMKIDIPVKEFFAGVAADTP